MWDSAHDWNTHLLETLLPAPVLQQLGVVHLDYGDNSADTPLWSLTADRNFSISSARGLLCPVANPD